MLEWAGPAARRPTTWSSSTSATMGSRSGDVTTMGVREVGRPAGGARLARGGEAADLDRGAGVSMGGAAAINEAASDSRVNAVILDSTHATLANALQARLDRDGYPLSLPGAWSILLGGLLRTGEDMSSADPVQAIARYRERPVLIIAAGSDRAIGPNDAADLLAAAREAGRQRRAGDLRRRGAHASRSPPARRSTPAGCSASSGERSPTRPDAARRARIGASPWRSSSPPAARPRARAPRSTGCPTAAPDRGRGDRHPRRCAAGGRGHQPRVVHDRAATRAAPRSRPPTSSPWRAAASTRRSASTGSWPASSPRPATRGPGRTTATSPALGNGGPGYHFEVEFPAAGQAYERYTVAMANSMQYDPASGEITGGTDTNGSQFFIDLDEPVGAAAALLQHHRPGRGGDRGGRCHRRGCRRRPEPSASRSTR